MTMAKSLEEAIAKETSMGQFLGTQTRSIPEAVLERLVTKEKISEWLKDQPSISGLDNNEKTKFEDTVIREAKKLFVISVVQSLPPSFLYYLVNTLKITDDGLPLKNDYITADEAMKDEAMKGEATADPTKKNKKKKNRSKKKKNKKRENQKNKTDETDSKEDNMEEHTTRKAKAEHFISFVNRFLPYQDTVCPPKFQEGAFERQLSSITNLPINITKKLGEGTHGNVYEINIEPESFNFQGINAAPAVFALKAIDSSRRADRELKFIQALINAKVDYSHIVRTYASFKYLGSHYFVLELATTDLRKFLKTDSSSSEETSPEEIPPNKKTYSAWLMQQMLGLARALDKIHNLVEAEKTGYIHDIAPKNILVFGEASDSVLKFADWSCANINEVEAGAKSHHTPADGGNSYGSPESGRNALTSRPHDIWSLGCVYLELLVWVFEGGPKGLDFFVQARKADDGEYRYDKFHKDVKLKSSVGAKLEELHGEHGPEWNAVLDLIRDMLKIKSEQRPKAKEVVERLNQAFGGGDVVS